MIADEEREGGRPPRIGRDVYMYIPIKDKIKNKGLDIMDITKEAEAVALGEWDLSIQQIIVKAILDDPVVQKALSIEVMKQWAKGNE